MRILAELLRSRKAQGSESLFSRESLLGLALRLILFTVAGYIIYLVLKSVFG